jgi:hypothetical protein
MSLPVVQRAHLQYRDLAPAVSPNERNSQSHYADVPQTHRRLPNVVLAPPAPGRTRDDRGAQCLPEDAFKPNQAVLRLRHKYPSKPITPAANKAKVEGSGTVVTTNDMSRLCWVLGSTMGVQKTGADEVGPTSGPPKPLVSAKTASSWKCWYDVFHPKMAELVAVGIACTSSQ